jgi:hypothetical protein
MNELWKGLGDLVDLVTRPLFTLGSTGVSIGRLGIALTLCLSVWWLARFSERALQRLAAHRPQQVSKASAYALGRIGRYLLLVIGLIQYLLARPDRRRARNRDRPRIADAIRQFCFRNRIAARPQSQGR